MSVDYSAPEGAPRPQAEADMFAPTPVWARTNSRKRRGFGSRRPAADAAAATPAMFATEPVGEHVTDRPDEPMLDANRTVSPTTAPASEARRRNAMPIALAGGVVVLAALAAAGWYESRPQGGVAELTPGAPGGPTPAPVINSGPTMAQAGGPQGSATASSVPANSVPANSIPAPQQLAATTTAYGGGAAHSPAASAHASHSARMATRTAAASGAPEASASATGAGVDTSATESTYAVPNGAAQPAVPTMSTSPTAPTVAPSAVAPTSPSTPATAAPSTGAAPAGSTVPGATTAPPTTATGAPAASAPAGGATP